ncbi:MAG: ABC transporter permease, partial [Rhodospirillaceae bacterium]|nr:ABC transporter permease [Rhodospirillaceae bacterium]
MNDFSDSLSAALRLVVQGDADLLEIVGLSLGVSITAVGLATLIGMPLGAAAALYKFPGR